MEQTLTKTKYKVAETYFKLDVSFNKENNEKLEKIINSVVEKEILKLKYLSEFQYSEEIIYEIEFEEGSTKIRVLFFATIVNGLIFYGSLRQGLSQVYSDIKWLSENVITDARQQDEIIGNNVIRTEKRTGLIGRLKRILDRIEYLQNNLNVIGNNQAQVELTNLYQELADIIQVLDLQERQTFVNNLPAEISGNLPEPNEKRVIHFYNLYGLKPKEE